jgi:hypothetical protein
MARRELRWSKRITWRWEAESDGGISNFDFRFSIFEFRFSIFDFRFSIFDGARRMDGSPVASAVSADEAQLRLVANGAASIQRLTLGAFEWNLGEHPGLGFDVVGEKGLERLEGVDVAGETFPELFRRIGGGESAEDSGRYSPGGGLGRRSQTAAYNGIRGCGVRERDHGARPRL